jgi:hypothetical protein
MTYRCYRVFWVLAHPLYVVDAATELDGHETFTARGSARAASFLGGRHRVTSLCLDAAALAKDGYHRVRIDAQ